MTEPKRYHTLPKEIFDAVRDGDFVALKAYRKTLTGDEVISARETLPVFDWMIQHMAETTPQERADIADLRVRLNESNSTRKLVDVIVELENCSIDAYERELMKKSPAMYAMRKMMFGEDVVPTPHHRDDPNKIVVGGKTYSLPEDVVIALKTLRPQFLVALRNKVDKGHVIPQDHASGMVKIINDYTDSCYTTGVHGEESDKYYYAMKERYEQMVAELQGKGVTLDKPATHLLLDTIEQMIEDVSNSYNSRDAICVSDGQGRGQSVWSLLR